MNFVVTDAMLDVVVFGGLCLASAAGAVVLIGARQRAKLSRKKKSRLPRAQKRRR